MAQIHGIRIPLAGLAVVRWLLLEAHTHARARVLTRRSRSKVHATGDPSLPERLPVVVALLYDMRIAAPFRGEERTGMRQLTKNRASSRRKNAIPPS